MHIASLEIRNFKGLKEGRYNPTRFGCIVGENNAGKSTILQAIATALERSPTLNLSHYYDPNEPVRFRLEVRGITEPHLRRLNEEHRPKIAELVHGGSFALIVTYPPKQRVVVSVERRVPVDERYREEAIAESFKNKRNAAVVASLAQHYPEFVEVLPEGTTAAAAKAHVLGKIAELPAEQFTTVESPLPTGISPSITALLPEPIYIPAVKDVHDDLKTTQSTSFGRLLGLLLENMTPDLLPITTALNSLNAFFNRVDDGSHVVDQRHDKVRELESHIETLLQENFPATRIELSVPPPELRTILNSAQILVDDGSKDAIENKGDGIKRSLTFALLQCYVANPARTQVGEGPEAIAARPLIFLFEEPELYLHPKSQRVLFSTLERLSHRFQVVVTTHSPLFFAPGATASFVRVAKVPRDPKPVGMIHEVNFELDAASAESFRLAKFENTDAAFFSRRVVLFEGESDDAYLKHVAKHLNVEWDFDAKNVALVQVSGKGNFARFRRFFESFGIEVKLVADLDAFFEGFHHLGADETHIDRGLAIQAIDRRITALGIPAEPNARQIKARVKSESWQARYDAARTALRKAQRDERLDADTLAAIDNLFVWEADIARSRVCKEDSEAAQSLVPCLDALRQQGICILARGAIEEYYPEDAPKNGPKPDRALAAIALVAANATARELGGPLAADREPELYEICAELFRDL